MNKTILIETRNVYGNDLIYPLNYREELFKLTGTKTLTPRHISALRSMGFDFFQKPLQVLEAHN